MLNSFFDYNLFNKISILKGLSLSFAHYNTPLFIHPPVFVYFSALCVSCSIPLVMVPILCQIVTVACMIRIVSIFPCFYTDKDYMLAMSWIIIMFGTCPIAVLVSQKYWIDNMVCCTVTVGVMIQMFIISMHSRLYVARSALNEFASVESASIGSSLNVKMVVVCLRIIWVEIGWDILWLQILPYSVFCLFACNTKITSLSVAPSLIILNSLYLYRIILSAFSSIEKQLSTVDSKRQLDSANMRSLFQVQAISIIIAVLISSMLFLVAFGVTHVPWMILNKVFSPDFLGMLNVLNIF